MDDWTTHPISEIMSRSPISVLASEPVASLRRLMNTQAIHHLPVLDRDGGDVVGMIGPDSLTLATVLEEAPHGHACTARDVMIRCECRLGADTAISAAARAMLERHTDALPVTDDQGALVGIITQVDMMRLVAESPDVGRSRVQKTR